MVRSIPLYKGTHKVLFSAGNLWSSISSSTIRFFSDLTINCNSTSKIISHDDGAQFPATGLDSGAPNDNIKAE